MSLVLSLLGEVLPGSWEEARIGGRPLGRLWNGGVCAAWFALVGRGEGILVKFSGVAKANYVIT